MSADNGIYIHKFREGYKVCHAQAIENIYWARGKKKYNYRILKEYFAGSPIYKTLNDAMTAAWEKQKEAEYTEYGISEV